MESTAILKKHNESKTKSDSKIRKKIGDAAVKEKQNERKAKSDVNIRMKIGDGAMKEIHGKRKRLSRNKQKVTNPQKFKNDRKRWDETYKLSNSEKSRLLKFLRSILYNAIFPCICCQRNLFESNVCEVDDYLIAQIETKKDGLFRSAVEMFNSEPLKVRIDGREASYICLACKKHLTSGKVFCFILCCSYS